MHGATYTVDCEFRRSELVQGSNWVIDIGVASTVLKEVLGKYNYKNLDDLPEFAGTNTTTEFMCKAIFDGVGEKLAGTFGGSLKITLSESHVAWASYSGSLSNAE